MFGCGKAMAVRRSCPCGPITSLMLLLLLMAGCRAQAPAVITAAVGGNVTLTPRFSGTFSSVVWKFHEDKVVEMDVDPPYLKFYDLGDRATLNNTTLALTITGLTKAESGTYLAEVVVTIDKKKKTEYTSIELRVLAQITATVGGSVTLTPRFSGSVSSVVWKFYEDKVVEMDVDPPYLKFYELGDRAALNNATLALTIMDLTKAESGPYMAEMQVTIDNKQKIESTSIELRVLDPVPIPTITNHTTAKDINVTCEAGGDAVLYRWEKGGQEVAKGQEYTAPRPREEVVLTCVASNEVSENRSSITILYERDPALVPAVTVPSIAILLILIPLLVLLIIYIFFIKKILKAGEENVTTNLYSDVLLPCKFPFVFGPSSLDMIWEKVEEDGTKRLLHKLTNGRHDLSEQDPQYRWRTKLSEDFSRGNLGLTLSDVVFADEGTYYCRAANERHHGDRKVELSVSGLEAQDPTVTSIHKDGSRDLKCIGRGLFREPRVLWFRQDMEELSGQATLTITDLGDRMKKVLPDVEKNEQYICDIEEGKFHRKVRAVISDGTSTIHVDGGGGDP